MTRYLLLVGLAVTVGCKDDAPKAKTAATPAAKSTEPAAPSGGGNTNYVSGGGAVQNVRQAAKRVDVMNEMKGLGLTITQMEITNGRMPTKADIVAEVRSDAKLSKLIADGTILLTGASSRSGLWAYEVDADTKGGIGLVGGTPNRYSADEIKNLQRGG